GESILAGDVGGTKTELALFARSGSGLREIRARTFPSREYTSLEGIVGAFLEPEPGGSVAAACFGVAGPVRGGKAKITNLPWELEEEALARTMGVPRVRLLRELLLDPRRRGGEPGAPLHRGRGRLRGWWRRPEDPSRAQEGGLRPGIHRQGGASRSGWPRFRCASPSIPAPPSWEPRTSCSKTPGSGSAVRLQDAVPRAHALGRLADVEPEAARRSLHQVRLRIGRAVHPPQPAPEDIDLTWAGHVELQALLLHPHRAAGHLGLPRLPCRRSSRACHAQRHSR